MTMGRTTHPGTTGMHEARGSPIGFATGQVITKDSKLTQALSQTALVVITATTPDKQHPRRLGIGQS